MSPAVTESIVNVTLLPVPPIAAACIVIISPTWFFVPGAVIDIPTSPVASILTVTVGGVVSALLLVPTLSFYTPSVSVASCPLVTVDVTAPPLFQS